MNNFDTKKLTVSGVISALIFLLTMVSLPSVAGGYIHLGDTLVFFSALIVGPFYGFLSASIGATLADIFNGYPHYAIITFFCKGTMSLIVYFLYTFLRNKNKASNNIKNKFSAIFFASSVASAFMVVIYFIPEIFFYGIGGAIANIPFNIIQGVASSALTPLLLIPIESIVAYIIQDNN